MAKRNAEGLLLRTLSLNFLCRWFTIRATMYLQFRRVEIFLLAVFFCMSTTLSATAAPAFETVARVHWLGMKQISADTNAARFLTVWQLPQTRALVAQT